MYFKNCRFLFIVISDSCQQKPFKPCLPGLDKYKMWVASNARGFLSGKLKVWNLRRGGTVTGTKPESFHAKQPRSMHSWIYDGKAFLLGIRNWPSCVCPSPLSQSETHSMQAWLWRENHIQPRRRLECVFPTSSCQVVRSKASQPFSHPSLISHTWKWPRSLSRSSEGQVGVRPPPRAQFPGYVVMHLKITVNKVPGIRTKEAK